MDFSDTQPYYEVPIQKYINHSEKCHFVEVNQDINRECGPENFQIWIPKSQSHWNDITQKLYASKWIMERKLEEIQKQEDVQICMTVDDFFKMDLISPVPISVMTARGEEYIPPEIDVDVEKYVKVKKVEPEDIEEAVEVPCSHCKGKGYVYQ